MRQIAFEENLGKLEELDDFGRRRSQQTQRVRRIPFDYVATFTLTGNPGTRVPAIINISAEAAFICTSIGYGAEEPQLYQEYLDKLQDIRAEAILKITEALKIEEAKKQVEKAAGNPIQFRPNIGLARSISPIFLDLDSLVNFNKNNIQGQIPGEDVIRNVIQNFRDALSFKYAIIDKGSGRELQNAPIHNLAGLGRLDGTRPFRELTVPYVFSPNSSILIEVTELVSLEGSILNIDFQGYKEFR